MPTGHGFGRSAGVLLPVSSLPSRYGIGNFGEDARRWVDFLHEAKQSYWQILPLSPTGEGDSPYQSFSAFAGNRYFIDLDALYEEGLLKRSEYANIQWAQSKKYVDYGALFDSREGVLRKAFKRFRDDAALDEFIGGNPWLEYYCLYMVVKSSQGLRSWIEWDEPLRAPDKSVIDRIKSERGDDIRFHSFEQFIFDRQWQALRAYANARGIKIIGDLPIYVSLDSADVWENPRLFQLGGDNMPLEVSGCPPDYYAVDGQLWGNPLYDWDAMANSGYAWWISRLRKSFDLFDVVRFDHFRGLESYYAIPFGEKTAKNGKWKKGPGKAFIDVIRSAVPDARIIAEDLGFITDEVRELLDYSAYPGMKIVQYAFEEHDDADFSPYSYDVNTVVYTGTHDNNTVKGWGEIAPEQYLRHAMDYMGLRGPEDLPQGMIRLAMQSCASLAVVPMQDWLELGLDTRLNAPATVGGLNWRWRMDGDGLTPQLAARMASMAGLYGRCALSAGAGAAAGAAAGKRPGADG